MRNYETERKNRVEYIRSFIESAGASGVVMGLSGGKDSALAAILAKEACDNTVGIIMPCESKRNYLSDRDDALLVADKFGIKTMEIDLTEIKKLYRSVLGEQFELKETAAANINPRLRMITLYAYAHAAGCLVIGTGNKSETYMGYFTKWGDGAYDFNPIGDLTVTEIYEFLEYLGCPEAIIKKAPSAALSEGQTDEDDMGVTYREIDAYIAQGESAVSPKSAAVIERYHNSSIHKMKLPPVYPQR